MLTNGLGQSYSFLRRKITPSYVYFFLVLLFFLPQLSFGQKIQMKEKKRGWAYFDGKKRITNFYEVIKNFEGGLAKVKGQNEKWGLLNEQFREVTKVKFDEINIIHGKAYTRQASKYGLVTSEGEKLNCVYEEIGPLNPQGFAKIKQFGEYGFIDFEGNIVISPTYTAIGTNLIGDEESGDEFKFIDGLITVQKEEKFGVINQNGQIVHPIEYEAIYSFNKTYFAYKKDNQFYVNEKGKTAMLEMEAHKNLPSIVDESPQFPGCEKGDNLEAYKACAQEKLFDFIQKEFSYPKYAKTLGIEGNVVIQFIVEKDGEITNAVILREIGGGCGKEALRIIRAMPKWNPGKQEGKTMRTLVQLPFTFKI